MNNSQTAARRAFTGSLAVLTVGGYLTMHHLDGGIANQQPATTPVIDLLGELDGLLLTQPQTSSSYCNLILLMGLDGIRAFLSLEDDERNDFWPNITISAEERRDLQEKLYAHFQNCERCQEVNSVHKRFMRRVTDAITVPAIQDDQGINNSDRAALTSNWLDWGCSDNPRMSEAQRAYSVHGA